jgi:hypothetical protein
MDAGARRGGLTQLAVTVAQMETAARTGGAERAIDARRLAALAQTLRDLAR